MKNIQQAASRRGAVEQKVRTRLSSSPLRSPLVAYRNAAVRPDDVLLASYPKSGNTWLRHMVTHLVVGRSSDWRGEIHNVTPGIASARSAEPVLDNGGRLIKTHERPSRSYRRAIAMVRDGRDVALSEYHYRRDYLSSAALQGQSTSDFIGQFLQGRTNAYGTWHDHVAAWKQFSERPGHDVLIIRYEDMKSDPLAQLRTINEFLGLGSSEAVLASAIESNEAGRLREREKKAKADDPSAPSFVRSATAGGWSSAMDESDQQLFERVAGASLRLFDYPTSESR